MLNLIKIDACELPELIELAYRNDDDLLNHFHVQKLNLQEAVDSTLGMINEVSGLIEMDNYKVMFDEVPIGYSCMFHNFLYSFGINKEFRKPEILKEWFYEIEKALGESFVTMLYPNNIRAIKFLQKQGMKIVDDGRIDVVTLKNN